MIPNTEATWQEFRQALESFIRKRVSNEADAQDILQDVFVKIHRNIGQLRDETRLMAWIYHITRNTIHDYYRQNRELVELPDVLIDVDAETAVSYSSGKNWHRLSAINDDRSP